MLPTLEEAIQAIKAGDKATGRQMLADILQADLENESAWLWLSGVADSDDEKRKCLQRVLEINPDNTVAKRGLALLAQRPGNELAEPPVPPPPPAAPVLSRQEDLQTPVEEADPEPPPLPVQSEIAPVPPAPVEAAEPPSVEEIPPADEEIPPYDEMEEPPEPEWLSNEAEAEPESGEAALETDELAGEEAVEDFEETAPRSWAEDNKTVIIGSIVVTLVLVCVACVVAGLVFRPVIATIPPTVAAAVGTETPTPTLSPTSTETPTPTHTPTLTPLPPTLTPSPTGTRVVADTPTVTSTPTRPPTPDPNLQTGQVVGVVASTIIDVLIDGVEYRVKYLLIDTPAFEDPERGTAPFGLEALEINRQLVAGQTVALEKDVSDVDEVGRLLRYVYVGDLMINEELIRQGVAWVNPVPPDTRYQSRFEQVQQDAQAAGVGVWSLASSVGPTPPAPAQVVIIAVDDVEEYVDLQNVGNSPQDLTGWRLLSERDGQSCTFEGVTMQPGESLRVWALLADSTRVGYNCGFAQNIWSNTEPDAAVLFNPEGIEVSRLD